MNALLRTEGLMKRWGGFAANSDISISLAPGARHALIGPNGAGKTTFINLLTGVLAPTSGKVFFNGEDITGLPQHVRVKRGMSRTFQINTLFSGLTVLESVILAIVEREGMHRLWYRTVAQQHAAADEAMSLLAMLRLERELNTVVRNLAYGKQRLIEIALALAGRPKLLLLDEPAAGIPSAESGELFETIARLPREVGILFIEHDMDLVFRFAERITVLAGGRVMAEGSPDDIAADPRVREVYLGESAHG
ncbi:ABC transporter ATP-binding protein [Noviherbaspirillum massiliense]|uniref:ABC transporter ATP-binding protein n=1 Tax=Noviherbaspirillum massiliense TaxID=1465823 RepID=UPI0003095354|nr:ABC transporter ATP-binding protein [Noviherbaspirillum massiliense]